MKKQPFFVLIVSVVVAELAGVLGSLFTTPNIQIWYDLLNKPAVNPPSWVFGPVWTTLYFLMGVAAYLVWKQGTKDKNVRIALRFYVLQLLVNIIWSYAFFGAHSPLAGLCVIAGLWLFIAATILVFQKVSKLAAWLMIPYIVWVSFATYLNFSLWILN